MALVATSKTIFYFQPSAAARYDPGLAQKDEPRRSSNPSQHASSGSVNPFQMPSDPYSNRDPAKVAGGRREEDYRRYPAPENRDIPQRRPDEYRQNSQHQDSSRYPGYNSNPFYAEDSYRQQGGL